MEKSGINWPNLAARDDREIFAYKEGEKLDAQG